MSPRWRRSRSRSRSPSRFRLPIEREHSGTILSRRNNGSRPRTPRRDRYRREGTDRYRRRSRSPAERRTRYDGEKRKGLHVQTRARLSSRRLLHENKDCRRPDILGSSGRYQRHSSDYSRKHREDGHLPTARTLSSHSESKTHRRESSLPRTSHNENCRRTERYPTPEAKPSLQNRKPRRRGIRYIGGKEPSSDNAGEKFEESANTVEDGGKKTEETGEPVPIHTGGIPVGGLTIRPFRFGHVVPMAAYPILLRPPPLFRPRVFRPFVLPLPGRFPRPPPYGYRPHRFYRPSY